MADLLARWRGAIAAVALAGLGLWWALGSGGIVAVLGWCMVALGAALGWSDWQRRRFAVAGDAPGLVEVLEGRISYFGPAGGGVAALSEIEAILIAERAGRRAWVLRSPGQPDLVIPVAAHGAAALFDAFGSLPGLTGGTLVAALEGAVGEGAGRGDVDGLGRDGPGQGGAGETGVGRNGLGQGNVLPMARPTTPQVRPVWQRPRRALR